MDAQQFRSAGNTSLNSTLKKIYSNTELIK